MSESIQTVLDRRLVAAMKARNGAELCVLRAIRAKIQTHKTAKNFDGVIDDALYIRTMGAYVKSMSAAIEDFKKGGDRGAKIIENLTFEIDYLSEFLPTKLDEEATQALVADVIAKTNASSPKQMGQVMGFIMKTHRDQVDAALARKLIEKALAN